MIKEQVKVEGAPIRDQGHLAPYKGKGPGQLKEEVAEVVEESSLDLSFLGCLGACEKVEVIWVFLNLLGQVRDGGKGVPAEVSEGLPCPLMQLALDLEYEHVLTPPVFEVSLEVPLPG